MVAATQSLSKNKILEERLFTIEEYFKKEEKSLHKHEYHAGKIVRMAGAKFTYNQLAARVMQFTLNFIEEFNLEFELGTSDSKIWIDEFSKVLYPDAVIISQKPEYYNNDGMTILNPLLIVEILSSSTQKHDRTTKFEIYRTVPSFKEYVLVNEDMPRVTVWTKQDNGSWLPKDYKTIEAVAILKTINNCPISLERLYRNI